MTEQKSTSKQKGKLTIKRLSKGQRLHARRLKQAARKEAVVVNPK